MQQSSRLRVTKSNFVDWFAQQNEFFTEIEEMEKEELNKCLRKFYMSARKQDGSYYNITCFDA